MLSCYDEIISWVVKQVSNQPVLRTIGLTKRFPGMIAVNHVDFEVGENEIHALIGENGAGKSTLCKMLTGVYPVDEGTIEIAGEKKVFHTPADSIRAGIGMLYQERNLVPFLTAAENISLGYEPLNGRKLIDNGAIIARAQELRRQLNVETPLNVPVEELGAGEQQLVEIMRAFYMKPKLLILDEPTASLGEGEIEPFLQFVKSLKDDHGVSIIYITHKLEEIMKIADKVTVLADGAVTLNADIAGLELDDCVRAMIRSDKIKQITVPEKDFDSLDEILSVDKLEFDGAVHNLNIRICRGEVVGFYGLVGSGRTESMEALFGLRKAVNKSFRFDGEEVKDGTTYEMIRRGMILTPELRSNGVFPLLDLVDNICDLFTKRFSRKAGVYKGREAHQFANDVLDKNKVRYRDSSQLMSELSGGNMQKVIIGRSVEVEGLKLIIVDEPTAGMDLGAKSEIYLKIRALADDRNTGVMFVSSELDELISVCDRIYVFYRGSTIASFRRDEFDKEQILSYAVKGAALNG